MGERVCIMDALGFSPGGELSSEDVSLIYQKVFHYTSTTDDVLVAMKKVAGEDEVGSCVGENILNVLLEMQKEKERKEELCWSQKLLTAGQHKDGYPTYTEDRVFQQVPDFMLAFSDPSTSKHAQNIWRPGSLPSGLDTDLPQTEPDRRRVLHLKRSARRCWARLVTEGVHSIAPRQSYPTALGAVVRGHALGCMTTADLLSVLEVKYDAVTRLLYTEMLRQHFGLSAWENLLPWQRDKEMEGLEDLAELALGSGDLFHLTELPGVFRIYKTREQLFPTRSSQSTVRTCWSAVNVLTEAYASLRREKDSLARVSRRLDRDSLKLMFLYIRLATFRAQSERWSYRALLAATQLWESWPCVSDTCRQEMVEQWLHGEDEKDRDICLSASPQQAVLQLLVLKQKAERENLLGLLRGVSLDQLEGPGNQCPVTVDQQRHCSLKDGCLRRLQEIRSSLQTHAPFPQIDSSPQPVTQPHQNQSTGAAGGSSQGSTSQWGECAVTLLRQLADAQENQVSLLLPSLLHMSIEHLQVLREKYRYEFQKQNFSNLLNLLSPDNPESSEVKVTLVSTPMSPSGPIKHRNRNAGLHNKSAADPSEHAAQSHDEPGSTPAAEELFQRQDLCTGCGASLEDLPYLEVISAPVEDGSLPEGEESGREDGSPPQGEEPGREREEPGREADPRGTQEGCEKQASLITLAWSKPTQCIPEPASMVEGDGTVDGEERSTAEPTRCETAAPSTVSHMDALEDPLWVGCAIQPVSAVQMHNSKQQQETQKTPSGDNFQEHGFATENGAVAVIEPLVPSAEIQQQFQQEMNTTSNHRMREAGREQTEVEVCSVHSMAEPWAHEGNNLPAVEDHEQIPLTTEADFPEKAKAMEAGRRKGRNAGEPLSSVERERTMHILVDMQRKVEKKQQRHRDRQLLRVQERLAIIQNKKAEEDLLGLKQKETLEHLTHNLPQEDKSQQKSVVRARLDQLRRERSCVMQSKRDRNTAGFKELLGPVVRSTDTDNSTE